MAFAIPVVGSKIEVCMKEPLMPSARYAGMPDYNWYKGTVLKSQNWMSPEMFCLSTENPDSPFRILDQDRILDLRYIDGSIGEIVEIKEKPKFQIWQVDGSKGDVYNVTLSNGKWSCDCISGQFNRSCKHVKKIQEKIND